jgi:alpha-1,3-mannosyltransferase
MRHDTMRNGGMRPKNQRKQEMPADSPLIVHVVRQFIPNRGGLEDVVANLCRKLITKGYRIRVVTLNSLFSDPERVLADTEVIDGIEVVRLPWSGSSRYPLTPSVFNHIRDADLIHVHAIDFFYDALALGWLLHRCPMVATTHGGFFHTKNHARIKQLWFNVTTRLSSSVYRSIACCSQADKRLFDQIASAKTVLIENGADTAKFADAASVMPVKRMITIGRFSANKRLDHLLDTTAALVARDPTWHLHIVGVPSDNSEEDILGWISQRGLQDHVSLHIGLANAAIHSLMAETSLFVSASDYEGFGLVAIEAMSAGLVPVLQANDAYTDLANRHAEIRLVDFARPQEAALGIEASMAMLETTGIKIRSAMMTAANTYSWDSVVTRYTDVYKTVLHSAAHPE